MYNIRTLLIVLAAIPILISCGKRDQIKQHETGFKYITYNKSEYGLGPRIGDIVIVKLKITAPNDSVLQEADNLQMQVQEPKYEGGTIDDILLFMNRGDSMAFFINGTNFYTYSVKEPAPEFLEPDDLLRFDIVMRDVMSMKKFEELRRQRLSTGELEERVLLDNFMEKISKKRTEIDSMLFWVPEKDGKGANIKENNIVELHYIAYFIDGKIFSNTYQAKDPFRFVVGDQRVIEGFNKVMPYLKNGSKGRIIIPSYLGYGSQGLQDMVPPFTSLVFDVEILEVIARAD